MSDSTTTTGPIRNDSLDEPITGLEPDAPLWDTSAMRAEFSVEAFAAPFVIVERRSDGAKGTLQFGRVGDTRYYFAFVAE